MGRLIRLRRLSGVCLLSVGRVQLGRLRTQLVVQSRVDSSQGYEIRVISFFLTFRLPYVKNSQRKKATPKIPGFLFLLHLLSLLALLLSPIALFESPNHLLHSLVDQAFLTGLNEGRE